MKHDLFITLILISLFLGSHVIGLFVIQKYLPEEKQLPLGIQKPEFNERTSYIPIMISMLIATLLALLLIKLSAFKMWKTWFFLSVFLTLSISFAAFVPELIALLLALTFSILKIFKPNIFIHNFTELFIYGGLAAVFVPVLSILSIVVLLILVSIYDMIAVWKTKHMILMAKFQAKSKIFAGLFVPYRAKAAQVEMTAKKKIETKKKLYRQAILGGGDIAFSLLFSGVILKNYGFFQAIITSVTAAIALFILFLLAEKQKFYPAMPFVTAGSILGYLIVLAL